MEQCNNCKYKETPRDENKLKILNNRLNRIVGQLKGVGVMIKDNRYCKDILIQVSAIQKALESFSYLILEEHLNSCVIDKIKNDDETIIDETLDLIKKIK